MRTSVFCVGNGQEICLDKQPREGNRSDGHVRDVLKLIGECFEEHEAPRNRFVWTVGRCGITSTTRQSRCLLKRDESGVDSLRVSEVQSVVSTFS